ncbi:6-pyruvoyl tetrahydropterin synthase family protein [Salinarchaeum sp. Harcht-Bsk1]|uniref:6-pyruvoyl trahydropterin synthase family protein n=1 Tax=Salinarchaeum sp. Harcht-Bsk1 TaxID=1333523 RepID=UPI0006780B9C|nr:6-pyruvoyl tetrahydropterin synthase family protein [Salinarchaeum sp. Harcht-Bsk1]
MPRGLSEAASSNIELAEAGERTLRIGGDSPIRISTGHRIRHHDGKCSRPHGHNYEITIEVTGTLTMEGWVVDKGIVTDIIDEWDHRFLLEKSDPLAKAFEEAGEGESLLLLDHPPTAEVMSLELERELEEELPENVSNASVTVRETGELCATY